MLDTPYSNLRELILDFDLDWPAILLGTYDRQDWLELEVQSPTRRTRLRTIIGSHNMLHSEDSDPSPRSTHSIISYPVVLCRSDDHEDV